MSTIEHNVIGAGDRHAPHNWVYADAAAREAATGFVSTDVGKWAKQSDNGTYWELTAVTPTWAQRTYAVGTAAGTVAAGNDSRLSDARTPTAHTQAASTITDFDEAVDDRVNALLVEGTNVTLTYDDTANTLTIDAAGGGGGGDMLGANNLSELTNTTTARTNLGLGSAATHDHTDYDAAGDAAAAVSTHVGLADPHTQYALESALGTLATQNGTFSGTSSGNNTGDQTISDATISTTDITTNNVSSTKHGFAPKSPADAAQFLNGAATPAFAAVKDSDLSTSDITTNDASTSKHGFLPKLDNDTTHFLNGQGAWTVPAGGGSIPDVVSAAAKLAAYSSFR